MKILCTHVTQFLSMVKSIPSVDLPNDFVFTVVDPASQLSENYFVAGCHYFANGDECQSHVWAVENIFQEYSCHAKAIWDFDS